MKLLLISINSFSKSANNGKTFESMLRGFKCEELAQLYFSAEVPDFDYCNRYFRITDIDIINSLTSLILVIVGAISDISRICDGRFFEK